MKSSRTRFRILASGLAMSLCPAVAQAEESLSIMSFGGAYQEAERKAVFEPYTAQTGIKHHRAGIRRRDRQDQGDDRSRQHHARRGRCRRADPAAGLRRRHFRNDRLVPDRSAGRVDRGHDLGMRRRQHRLCHHPGLSTTEKLADGPKTIADLFDTEKFPGKRGLWKNPATNLEFALLADGVDSADVSTRRCPPRKASTVPSPSSTPSRRTSCGGRPGAQAPQLLASGEVVMTTAWNGRISQRQQGRQASSQSSGTTRSSTSISGRSPRAPRTSKGR